MKYSKIVLAGGNGYLGTVLKNYFKSQADEVVILSRRSSSKEDNVRTVVWDGETDGDWKKEMNGAELVVNLCGKNVNCRYTKENQKQIIASRTIPTALLGKAIGEMDNPPDLWVNVTSATIYRHAQDRPQDEVTGEVGYGFSIDVCKQWERAFFSSSTPYTRKIALRMGIVLGRNDGVFPRLLNLVRTGMGGRQGDGRQMISWIHEQDAARIIDWLMDHPLEGTINCTAPESVSNAYFMHSLRRAYGIPFGLSMPQWLLELGASMIGTETELILKSRWVKPRHLIDAGYNFMFANVNHAIHDILSLRK